MVQEEVEELESFQPNILTKHCQFCKGVLDQNSKLINSNGNLYHTRCFVCAQCFQPFKVMKRIVDTTNLLIWDNDFNRMEHSLSLKAESIVSMTSKYYLHLAVPSVLIL